MVLTALTLSLLLGQARQNPPIKLPPAKINPQQRIALPGSKSDPPPNDTVGTADQEILNITKHVPAAYNPAMVPVNGSWAGAQDQDIREGSFSFSLVDSRWGPDPCKLFKAESDFEYHPKVRNKKVVFTPKVYVFAQISLAGKLLHMTTAYNGFGIAAPVQIEATFHKDSIDIKKTEGTVITQTTLYPNFDMSLFDNLFDPLMKDGLVVAKERQLAFLHPITGAPCIIKATLNGRFNGEHEYRKYEGYKFDVTSPDTKLIATSFVTRHGQLLQVNLPENQDAIAYTFVSPDEERNWGKFQPGDWDKPASITQPGRKRYHAIAVPVLLTNPSYMILPLPYLIAM